MTQSVTVQTDFRDLQQMAEGLAGRVHATHVILPAGDAVDEGEWAQWAIALYDGSSGLAGMGRCVTVVDNGEEREAHQRFDVVFDSLQFDDDEQRVFEHILALHGTSGEASDDVEDVMDAESVPAPRRNEHSDSFVDVSSEFTGSQRLQLEDEIPGENTMIASEDEFAPVNDTHRPAVAVTQAVSYGSQSTAVAHVMHAQILQPQVVRAVVEEPADEPLSGERIAPVPRPVNGTAFAYANGIPFPAKPPRPELDPSLRVTPAPRPAGMPKH